MLTGDGWIMQHAIGAKPDPAHGSCTDDVSRALEVDLLHGRTLGWAAVAERAWRNVRFLRDAFDPAAGTFRNFRRVDGSWVAGTASEDSQGRAMLALGTVIGTSPDGRMVALAASLFDDALPEAVRVTAIRAQASIILGCDAAIRIDPTDATDRAYRLLARRLHSAFHAHAADDAWPWPEPMLTYENGLPPRALIVAGRWLGSTPMIETGRRALDWLISIQTADAGHLSPIGNGWWPRDGKRSTFDQQPIEPTALLLAAEAAFDESGDERYLATMERCYAWFLGANDAGVAVADPDTGAGFDGLERRGANQNQGAESTLMWLVALEHIRAVRTARAEAATRWPDLRPAAPATRPTPTGRRRGRRRSSARCASARRHRWRAATPSGAASRRPPDDPRRGRHALQALGREPDPDRGRRAVPRQHGLQPRRGAGRRRDHPAGPRRGPAGDLAAPRRAQRRRRDRLDLRSRAAAPLRRRRTPRRSGAARTRG